MDINRILGLAQTEEECKEMYELEGDYMEFLETLAKEKTTTKEKMDNLVGEEIPNLMWKVFIEKKFIKEIEKDYYHVNLSKIKKHYRHIIKKYAGKYSLTITMEKLELLLNYSFISPNFLHHKMNMEYYKALEYLILLKKEGLVEETENYMLFHVLKEKVRDYLEKIKDDDTLALIESLEKLK
jgi:hypothetical protein